MREFRNVLIEYYLDWRNNYMSVDKFAEHNGLTLDEAITLIALGKDVFNHKHPEE